jgi:hypothetical protein
MREVENSCSIEQKQATRVAGGKSRWRGKFCDEIFACDWNAPRAARRISISVLRKFIHFCMLSNRDFSALLHSKFKAGSKNDDEFLLNAFIYTFSTNFQLFGHYIVKNIDDFKLQTQFHKS